MLIDQSNLDESKQASHYYRVLGLELRLYFEMIYLRQDDPQFGKKINYFSNATQEVKQGYIFPNLILSQLHIKLYLKYILKLLHVFK